MPWQNTPEKRRRDAAVYSDPEYVRNRRITMERAGGRCSDCSHRHSRLQCDHVIPVTQGGGHELANLTARCAGPASCRCHERKTAQEGGGYRAPRKDPDPDPVTRTRW
jgi:hypothetical protein